MTSATEILRRLLDERGVEWEDFDGEPTWAGGDGRMHYARQEFTFAGLTDEVTVYHLTPEQAVEATLGRGTCRIGRGISGLMHVTTGHCSECGAEVVKPARYCPNCGRRCVG